MKRTVSKLKSNRNCTASALVEFGPALFAFLITLLFPIIDLLAIATVYSIGSAMNDEQLREAALSKRSQAEDVQGSVKYGIPTAWRKSGLGRYAKIDSDIETTIFYTAGPDDEYGNAQKFIRVGTSFSVKPFISVPFPTAVPGLNADLTLRFAATRLLEYPPNYEL